MQEVPEALRPCWTWKSYAYGALGWVFTVSTVLYIAFEKLRKAQHNSDAHDAKSTLVTILTYTQCTSFLIVLPVMSQWILGFVWPGGIQGPRGVSLRTPTSSESTLSDALLPEENGVVAAGSGLLCFRVCTRGDLPVLVKETCRRNQELLNELGVPSIIEVVTDNCLGLPDTRDLKRGELNNITGCAHVVQMVVPSSYQTARGTLFKARALNYALKQGGSCLEDDDIVVHLDEETMLHSSSVRGIQRFAQSYTDERIGQGVIVYGHGDIVRTLFTCLDSVRVADDWCRFRLNLSMGSALVGMHGSYVVNSAGLERKVTYDFGPEGSVTEDAFFAIAALDMGYKFAFIDGYMEEKSPFTLMDFLKQRRRWLRGLTLVSRSPEFSWRLRWVLHLCTDAWWLTPFMLPLTLTSVFCVYFLGNVRLPPLVVLLQGLAFGTVLWVYAFGASYNFKVGNNPLLYLRNVLMTALFAPLAGILESACVLYAWFTPEDVKKPKFHIVEKEYGDMKKLSKDLQNKAAEQPVDGKASGA